MASKRAREWFEELAIEAYGAKIGDKLDRDIQHTDEYRYTEGPTPRGRLKLKHVTCKRNLECKSEMTWELSDARDWDYYKCSCCGERIALPPTGAKEGQTAPPRTELIKDNFHLVCARCGDTLGGHLGYRCPDDKGEFTEQTGQAQEAPPK